MVTTFQGCGVGNKVLQGHNTNLSLGSQCKSNTDVWLLMASLSIDVSMRARMLVISMQGKKKFWDGYQQTQSSMEE